MAICEDGSGSSPSHIPDGAIALRITSFELGGGWVITRRSSVSGGKRDFECHAVTVVSASTRRLLRRSIQLP